MNPEAKVIIISDSDDPELLRLARAAGAVGFVLKDSLIELLQVLESL